MWSSSMKHRPCWKISAIASGCLELSEISLLSLRFMEGCPQKVVLLRGSIYLTSMYKLLWAPGAKQKDTWTLWSFSSEKL